MSYSGPLTPHTNTYCESTVDQLQFPVQVLESQLSKSCLLDMYVTKLIQLIPADKDFGLQFGSPNRVFLWEKDYQLIIWTLNEWNVNTLTHYVWLRSLVNMSLSSGEWSTFTFKYWSWKQDHGMRLNYWGKYLLFRFLFSHLASPAVSLSHSSPSFYNSTKNFKEGILPYFIKMKYGHSVKRQVAFCGCDQLDSIRYQSS